MTLQLYEDCTREQVHDLFAPETPFTPGAAHWGLHGIVHIPQRPGDFVFFVSFGRQVADHQFDEGITEDGVLTWQSQPGQKLTNPTIQQLIAHDEDINSIYLFLRTSTRSEQPYAYLGRLKYLRHDLDRERPVWFQWQILDWDIPAETLRRMGLDLETARVGWQLPAEKYDQTPVVAAAPPRTPDTTDRGVSTAWFRARRAPDWASLDRRNRTLGRLGEEFVVEHERRTLTEAGLADLAQRIRHIAREEGDGAGYDVLSFTLDEEPKYIEVKTTAGPAETDFFLSANELHFSQARADSYYLYRVFEFNADTRTGQLYIVPGSVKASFTLRPVQYKVSR